MFAVALASARALSSSSRSRAIPSGSAGPRPSLVRIGGPAYTPAAIASLRRALADVKAGRVFELSEQALVTGNYPRRRPRGGRADSRKGTQLPVPVEWRRTWTGEPMPNAVRAIERTRRAR